MAPEDLFRVLREIAVISVSKTWISLHGAGEPLLHPRMSRILENLPLAEHLDLGFLTNGMLLDDTRAGAVLESPLSWIGFSIDGIDREKFNRYRCGSEYDTVVSNALRFIDRARKSRPEMRIVVNMTVQEEMKDDVPAFVRFWLPLVDNVSISPCRPISTRINPLVDELPRMERAPCYMLFSLMTICWDGSAALCCEDWFNEGRMGNVLTSGVRDIWEGERFASCRDIHRNGEFSKIRLCKDCNSWYNAAPQESFDPELRCLVSKTAWQTTYRAVACEGSISVATPAASTQKEGQRA